MPLFTLPMISFIVACFVVVSPVHAAQSVPYKMNFQGRLTNASGTALTGTYDVELKLYTLASGGTFVWGETRTAGNGNAVTVTNGLFSILIGEGTAVAGSSATLQAAIAANQTLFLEVRVGAETLTPRSQLGSSAYAINSDMLDGYDSSYFAPATGSAAYAPISGSTNYAPISGSTSYIQNGTSSQSASFNVSGTGTVGGNFTSNGSALFYNATNSASAFTIQRQNAEKLFVADTTASRIHVGNPTPDAIAVVLVLDSKNTAGDPTGTPGAMYYNTADGDYRAYQGNNWTTIQPVRYAYLSSDISTTSTSFGNATGLSFAVEANKNYELSCSIIYRTAATTTGIGISLNGPASPAAVLGQFISNSSATALNGRSFNAYNGGTKTTGVQTANTDTYGLFNATFRNGATAGTLQLRYATEVSSSAATIRTGTYCKLTEI